VKTDAVRPEPTVPATRTKAPAATHARRFEGGTRTLAKSFRELGANEPATLTFQANVPAEVALDGRSLGQTPKSVTAQPGDHTVVFVHPELGEKAHTVKLAPGEDRTIRATFEPRTAE
jgi:serine/threonine-protein kinase